MKTIKKGNTEHFFSYVTKTIKAEEVNNLTGNHYECLKCDEVFEIEGTDEVIYKEEVSNHRGVNMRRKAEFFAYCPNCEKEIKIRIERGTLNNRAYALTSNKVLSSVADFSISKSNYKEAVNEQNE